MMYHAGFRPEGVFTAPLYRGRVIVPLGLPAGTLIPVNCSMGMSNLPDFRSWTGPARSGFVSESGGGNCEMSTLVPIEASGGRCCIRDQARSLLARGHSQHATACRLPPLLSP